MSASEAQAIATTPSAMSPALIRFSWLLGVMPRSTAARTMVGKAKSASTPTISRATVPAMSQRTALNMSRMWNSLDGVRRRVSVCSARSGSSRASGRRSTRASSSGVALMVEARPLVGTITRSWGSVSTSGHRSPTSSYSVSDSGSMEARYSSVAMTSSRGPCLTTTPSRTTATRSA